MSEYSVGAIEFLRESCGDFKLPQHDHKNIHQECHAWQLWYPNRKIIIDWTYRTTGPRCNYWNYEKDDCPCVMHGSNDDCIAIIKFLQWCKSAEYDSDLIFLVVISKSTYRMWSIKNTALYAAIQKFRGGEQ